LAGSRETNKGGKKREKITNLPGAAQARKAKKERKKGGGVARKVRKLAKVPFRNRKTGVRVDTQQLVKRDSFGRKIRLSFKNTDRERGKKRSKVKR